MMVLDFSFAEHAAGFDSHIRASIPGYDRFRWWAAQLSRRFAKPGTRVIDVGCSTGSMLREIRDTNQSSRPSIDYLGIDVSEAFREQWRRIECQNLRFQVCDVTAFAGFHKASLIVSSFTLQFIADHGRIPLLKRIHDGLLDGGALFIAEKTLAASSTLQDVIAFTYYDHKRTYFSAEEILDKERRLRGMMMPWTRARLIGALHSVGFQPHEIEPFWQDGPFVGLVVRKETALFSSRRPCPLAASDRQSPASI